MCTKNSAIESKLTSCKKTGSEAKLRLIIHTLSAVLRSLISSGAFRRTLHQLVQMSEIICSAHQLHLPFSFCENLCSRCLHKVCSDHRCSLRKDSVPSAVLTWGSSSCSCPAGIYSYVCSRRSNPCSPLASLLHISVQSRVLYFSSWIITPGFVGFCSNKKTCLKSLISSNIKHAQMHSVFHSIFHNTIEPVTWLSRFS